jgi:hypothetical protein
LVLPRWCQRIKSKQLLIINYLRAPIRVALKK